MNNYLRKESLILGLDPGEHVKDCGCAECKDAPLSELQFAASQHPMKEMRNLQIMFFQAFAKLLTEYEEEALDIFDLPSIGKVRESIISGDSEYEGKFKISRSKINEYKAMLARWQYALIADKELLKQDEEEDEQSAVYNWYLLASFVIGLKRVKNTALQNVPDDLRAIVEQIEIAPDTNNRYLQAIHKDGLKRIKIKIADDIRDDVIKQLKVMAKEGRNPLYVARRLHKKYEGNAWYWNRLARSESALALNASYDAWSNAAGVLYDVWSAGGSRPCPICVALDGQMWRRGEGPLPVVSTHPHCFLGHEKIYTSNGFVAIRDIKEDDLVLSHLGKFRKVTNVIKYYSENRSFVKISYKNSAYSKDGSIVSIVVTDNHPFVVNDEWVDALKVNPGDKIKILATRCRRCNKLIPFSRWRDNKGEESLFCSSSCQIQNTFNKLGIKYMTEQFIKNGKKMFKAGKHPFQIKKKESLSRGNTTNSKKKYNTTAEQILKKEFQKRGINYIHQFKIDRPEKRKCGHGGIMNRFYKVDFLLPDVNIVIECNGPQWKRDIEIDEKRELFIEQCGYTVLNFENNKVINNVEATVDEIERIHRNHSGKYEFLDMDVISVESFSKSAKLYNLSVDVDESYIAKGFVVHNCACERTAKWQSEGQRPNPAWQRESPYESPYRFERDENGNLFVPELQQLFN